MPAPIGGRERHTQDRITHLFQHTQAILGPFHVLGPTLTHLLAIQTAIFTAA
ncbi:hypothetical protein Lferr_1013 [Acidithiobacillus ferrooxidans ATCC 53993]|nr:hypothetical protein Lferr_1013 [Acidithiobacillus ferrooxidans ATCC 53993]